VTCKEPFSVALVAVMEVARHWWSMSLPARGRCDQGSGGATRRKGQHTKPQKLNDRPHQLAT